MKTYNKTYLPESIVHKGTTYTRDSEATEAYRESKYSLSNKKNVLVFVLSNNLKGREDFNGKIYQPTVWVFSNDATNLPDQFQR